MKNILATGITLLALVLGGVYLVGHASLPSSSASLATSTPDVTAPAVERDLTVIPEVGEVTLALNETAAFKGFLITPTEVVEDSRCPIGVACIQAGTVRVKLTIHSDFGTTTKTVKLGDSITTTTQKVTFSSVDPVKTTTTINGTEYRFTVKVEKLGL